MRPYGVCFVSALTERKRNNMNRSKIFGRFFYAGIMGILTILLCLVIADDIFGLSAPPARSQMGHPIFLVSLISLPLLFHKVVPWKYTLLNIPLFFLLYFPVYELCGTKLTHSLLETNGFLESGPLLGAILVTALFWGVQSLVYFVCNVTLHLLKVLGYAE